MCFRPGELDIPKICPECKTMNDKDATVCKECGAVLPDELNTPMMPDMPAPPGAPGAPAVPGAPSAPAPPAPPGQSSN